MALVSVIITSYNYADYIKETIESVIKQTYTNWELIIVDDGSTDNSVEIIKSYMERDSRIKLFQHPNGKNRGLSASLKLGIKEASGEWVAFLESDDFFAPDSLEKKLEAIKENSQIDLLFTGLEMFGDDDKIKALNKHFDEIEKNIYPLTQSGFIKDYSKKIHKVNLIPTFSVVMVKKNLIEKCRFDSPCKAAIDHYLWVQLFKYNVYYLSDKLTCWRIHKDSYIHVDEHSWFTRFWFYIKIYKFIIYDKPAISQVFLMLNYIRERLIYVKINKKAFKISLLNDLYIFELKNL